MSEFKETVSLRKIILELKDEEMDQDKKYAELQKRSWDNKLEKTEEEKLNVLLNKYDEDNYYRNYLRYYNNIIENNDFANTKKQSYEIPIGEKEFVKLLLREYGSPFMKKMRSKRLSQVTFSEFDEFIKKIEKQVDLTYKDEKEKKVFLTKLNLFTNYQERRRLYDLKKEVEETLADDFLRLQDLSNGQLKNSLIEDYYRSIKKLSHEWQKEIDIQVEIEEAVIEEMIEEEIEVREETANTTNPQDHADIKIPYNEDADDEEWSEIIPSINKEEMEKKRKKWEKIIRLEKEEKK